MGEYTGKSVFKGIAIGKISVYHKNQKKVKRTKVTDIDREIRRYKDGVKKAGEQLQELYKKALVEVGEANAAIFEIHQMMLEDDDYSDSVINIIQTQKVNAEYAVAATGDNFARMFASMDDEYMRGRAADIKDVSERLIGVLLGDDEEEIPTAGEPVIILAEDLAPSETVQMDKENVLAFVTINGSINSHTAILARTMGIPALVSTGITIQDDIDGSIGIVDGNAGKLYVNPDADLLEKMRKQQENEEQQKELLSALKGRDAVTTRGKRIKLFANIGNIKDLALVLQNDAAGIGLFRSEFIYLEKDDYPTEEEQFQIYRTVVETMAGRQVIIRTLDIGADKTCEYFNMEHEENPALGFRAIRICLTRKDIFKTQLRALYRASAYGNLAIMYPMITSLWEVDEIHKIEAEVKKELTQQGIAYGTPLSGIMIETPAAVMVSEELAPKVDFFSIGTNDLTQYTLAVDRQNPKLDKFYDSHHPAVLKMLKMVVDNAHKAGIWAGICGELAADLSLTKTFIDMGVDELSVSPGYVLPVKKNILEA